MVLPKDRKTSKRLSPKGSDEEIGSISYQKDRKDSFSNSQDLHIFKFNLHELMKSRSKIREQIIVSFETTNKSFLIWIFFIKLKIFNLL